MEMDWSRFTTPNNFYFKVALCVGILQAREAEADQKKNVEANTGGRDEAPGLDMNQHRKFC